MSNDISDGHLENARSSIRASLESDSNVTDASETQPAKHSLDRISTNEGTQIDLRDEQFENAPVSMTLSWESSSNITVRRDLQENLPPKQSLPIIRTEAGMQINCIILQLEKVSGSSAGSFDSGSNVTILRWE
jgi:hypothetical protein